MKYEGSRCMYICMYVYIGFKTSFYVVRHLDSVASYLPTGLHLRFYRSWPSLYLPSSFSSVFLVLSFVSPSTSMIFWVIFLLPFFEHGRIKPSKCVWNIKDRDPCIKLIKSGTVCIWFNAYICDFLTPTGMYRLEK